MTFANCPYLAAHAYLDNETSTVVKTSTDNNKGE